MSENKTGSPRFLQIGEAADRSERTQRTLRYYEEKGLLRPPERMEGGFRLYSPEDMERIERIKQFQELLGFSLAEIKDMLEHDDVLLQIKAEWDRDADAAEKAAKIRISREAIIQQLLLIDQKMQKMSDMREQLTARLARNDARLQQWSAEGAERVSTP